MNVSNLRVNKFKTYAKEKFTEKSLDVIMKGAPRSTLESQYILGKAFSWLLHKIP